MIIYIYGDDTYRSRHYLQDQIAKFKQARDTDGYNSAVLDASETTPTQLLEQLHAAPFLGQRRLVVIKNPLAAGVGETAEVLGEYVAQNKLPASTVLIVWQGEPASAKQASAKKLHDSLKKEKYVTEFAPLTGGQLASWIDAQATSAGARLSPQARSALMAQAGEDSWSLAQLIAQLAAYARDREITVADVERFAEPIFTEQVFQLVEAVFAGDRVYALKLFAEQHAAGVEPGKLFFLIIRQLRFLTKLLGLIGEAATPNSFQLSKQAGVPEFVVKKNLALAKRLTPQLLADWYERLVTIDVQQKTGWADQTVLLELLLARS